MRISLFTREVVPFFLRLALLGLVALAFDALLHWLNAVWIGRYLGIPGVLLIVGSYMGHGVLLVFGAPSQHSMPVGQEHGRTIPLSEVDTLKIFRADRHPSIFQLPGLAS